MADIYVRSTDGNNADDGSTWALAKLDLAGAAAIDSAGDTIYFSDAHAESTATAITWALAGTDASPVRLIGVDDAAEPPTAVSVLPTISTTGASGLTLNGSCYVYGLTFNLGTGAVVASFLMNQGGSNTQVYKSCNFNLVATGSSLIRTTNSGASNVTTIWEDCFVKFSATGQRIYQGRGKFHWNGGGITAGGSTPATIFNSVGTGGQGNVLLSGLDFSTVGAGVHIFQGDGSTNGNYTIRNCKLPASWTGTLVSGTLPGASGRFEMHNCDSADTNYRLWVEDYYGSIKSETTLVKTGGASDGATPFSLKMVSSANATYPSGLLESIELPARWNSTVGSAITVTVDVLHDSLTNLTDAEIWLKVQYLGTSGFPLSSFISDAKADVLATAADQTASAATWTTTGMTNPNKQKLAVTFTPQEAGFLQAKVMLAKASTTVYIDAKLQVS